MTTKVMRFEIIKPVDDTWTVLGQALRDVQCQSWKYANKAIEMLWDWNNFSNSYKARFGEYFDLKKTPLPNGYKNIESDINNELKDIASKLNANGRDALIRMVKQKWESEFKSMISGKSHVVDFKADLPIELHNKQFMNSKKEIMLYKENDKYIMKVNLISKDYAKELGKKSCSFKLIIKSGDNTQKTILDRIISKEYKLGMSKILKIKKGNIKWFLNLSYTFEDKKDETLDPNRIMGIDLGINIPAYVAINDDKFFREAVGDKDEIQNFRKQIESRKKKLLRQGKWCGEGRIGHGRKTRIAPIEKLSEKISNFRNLKNHCWSRYIIDLAVKNKCGIIQMEDLSGIADGERKSTFLGNWTYYDLQSKIKYKAKENGIDFRLVKPNYTSARCNCCGFIHRSEVKHIYRPTQDQFKCMNCDYGHKFYVNADYNAAKNIATYDIENIIKEQLARQEAEYKNSLMMES